MRRSVVRSVSVLLVIMVLVLGTMAAPASAGNLTGAGEVINSFFSTPDSGNCVYVEDLSTGHFFIGIRAGQPGTSPLGGIKVIGPLASMPLPGQFGASNCPLQTFGIPPTGSELEDL
jgi:hypothetical protein